MQVEGLSAEELAYKNAKAAAAAAAAASPEPRIVRTDSGRMVPDVSGFEDSDGDADETDAARVGKLNINEYQDASSQTFVVDVKSKDENHDMQNLLKEATKEKEALQAELEETKKRAAELKEKEALQAELEETKKRAAELELNSMTREDIAAKDAVDAEEATPAPELKDEQEGKSSNAKKRRCWWLCLLLLAALVALAGILGAVVGRGGGNANSSQANEGVGVVADDADSTQAPVSSPIDYEGFCPPHTRSVELRISLGASPSDVTWVMTDTCSGDAKYRCNRCYEDALPNVPVSFEGCLPTTSTFEGDKGPAVGRLRRAQALRMAAYELQIINASGGKSDFGYTLIYDGVPVSEVEEFANFDTTRFGEDGGAGGCTGSPTETPATDPPTSPPLPDVPYLRPTPKPSSLALDSVPPTQLTLLEPNYENELDSCFATEEQTSMCAEDVDLEQEIRRPDFGSSVTFVGDSGEYFAAGSSDFPTHVHIYQRLGNGSRGPWSYLWTISVVDDVDNEPSSGTSLVSNDEGYIFVGTHGAVFVFRPDSTFQSWSQVARLAAPEQSDSRFGQGISAYGKKLAVSSPYENDRGAVYIFEERDSEWTEIAVISPQTLSNGAQFGFSVSLYGESPALLAVGAPEDGIGGSAWVFQQSLANEWVPQLITIRDVSPGDYLGAEIVIDSCTVAVTSLFDRTTYRTSIGTVRLFQWNDGVSSWVPTSILDIGAENVLGEPDQYGECLALEGNTLLVATFPLGLKSYSGVIHHYERYGGQWQKRGLVLNESFLDGDNGNFGCPLDLKKGRVVIGHSENEVVQPLLGSVLVFELCPSKENV